MRADSNFKQRFYFFLLSPLSQPRRASVAHHMAAARRCSENTVPVTYPWHEWEAQIWPPFSKRGTQIPGQRLVNLVTAARRELSFLGSACLCGCRSRSQVVGIVFLKLQTTTICASTRKLRNSARCCGVLSVNSCLTGRTKAGGRHRRCSPRQRRCSPKAVRPPRGRGWSGPRTCWPSPPLRGLEKQRRMRRRVSPRSCRSLFSLHPSPGAPPPTLPETSYWWPNSQNRWWYSGGVLDCFIYMTSLFPLLFYQNQICFGFFWFF